MVDIETLDNAIESCGLCLETPLDNVIYESLKELKEYKNGNYKKELRIEVINECIDSIKSHWVYWQVGVIRSVIDFLEKRKEEE